MRSGRTPAVISFTSPPSQLRGKLSASLGGERHVHIAVLTVKPLPKRTSWASKKFICGTPMKPATKMFAGWLKTSCGVATLDNAVLHDHDAVAKGHGLGLVVSNVDEGALDP